MYVHVLVSPCRPLGRLCIYMYVHVLVSPCRPLGLPLLLCFVYTCMFMYSFHLPDPYAGRFYHALYIHVCSCTHFTHSLHTLTHLLSEASAIYRSFTCTFYGKIEVSFKILRIFFRLALICFEDLTSWSTLFQSCHERVTTS